MYLIQLGLIVETKYRYYCTSDWRLFYCTYCFEAFRSISYCKLLHDRVQSIQFLLWIRKSQSLVKHIVIVKKVTHRAPSWRHAADTTFLCGVYNPATSAISNSMSTFALSVTWRVKIICSIRVLLPMIKIRPRMRIPSHAPLSYYFHLVTVHVAQHRSPHQHCASQLNNLLYVRAHSLADASSMYNLCNCNSRDAIFRATLSASNSPRSYRFQNRTYQLIKKIKKSPFNYIKNW